MKHIKPSATERYNDVMAAYCGLTGEEIERKMSANAARVATQLHSEGSVRLSLGRYKTLADIENIRKRIDELTTNNEPHSPANP